MSAVYTFPFDIKAFLADTMELTSEAKGLYLMLLLNYYQRGHGCRTSVTTLATVSSVSEEVWRIYGPEILDLFEVRDGHLWHARCEKEIAKIKSLQEQRKRAGQASGAKTKKERPTPRTDHERPNGRDNGETTSVITPDITTLRPIDSIVSKEESSLRELKKKAAEAIASATPAAPLHIPLPSDFELSDEDIAHCKADGADPPWVLGVFRPWKQYHLDAGTLTTDWKAAWWRRWDKAKPPAEPEPPPKPKPRLVVSAGKASVKTLLPADWQPNANNALVCAEEGYDLDAMAEHFRNVCGANGYRYVNHHLAFTNFIRNQKNFTRGNHNARPKQSLLASSERVTANLDAAIREAEEDEARLRDGGAAVRKLSED